jgi:transposase-like protein
MGGQRHSAEQIIGKLPEAEVLQGKGMPMEEILRKLGISDATYYKWRKEYGGLRIDQATRCAVIPTAGTRGTLPTTSRQCPDGKTLLC